MMDEALILSIAGTRRIFEVSAVGVVALDILLHAHAHVLCSTWLLCAIFLCFLLISGL